MQLLVSVRSETEAELAVQGGAALIDVKEPAHGPLGAAAPGVIAEVIRQVDGRCPVSAALGELTDAAMLPALPSGLRFVKWGLANQAGQPWQQAFRSAGQRQAALPVLTAYADAQRASAPTVAEVVQFGCAASVAVLLLDTFDKSAGCNLLHWLSLDEIAHICATCRTRQIRVALAGSLGRTEIMRLLPCRPDWFAVRGAVCAAGHREQALSLPHVQQLVQLLAAAKGGDS